MSPKIVSATSCINVYFLRFLCRSTLFLAQPPNILSEGPNFSHSARITAITLLFIFHLKIPASKSKILSTTPSTNQIMPNQNIISPKTGYVLANCIINSNKISPSIAPSIQHNVSCNFDLTLLYHRWNKQLKERLTPTRLH